MTMSLPSIMYDPVIVWASLSTSSGIGGCEFVTLPSGAIGDAETDVIRIRHKSYYADLEADREALQGLIAWAEDRLSALDKEVSE